ncbi:hypothetical protein IP78_05810 [Brevundimonas sp. AAP58]|uniref:PIN domain-containing protein n=1 Tax=Brevundimonas sp. AAP58 TaxID=1523422 RepID=UPI0006B8E9C6|nr:PIN domain-containing protein [Brevundimonas sp. AAP58]KPF81058.1 hypothetical protein IP78_05810 [Brevundimonas sp. AAP58]
MTEFLDTNVVIYAIEDEGDKRAIARGILARNDLVVSVQTLNEFVSVARRKLRMSWDEIIAIKGLLRTMGVAVVPVSVAAHEHAVALAVRNDIHIYDATIIACALEAGCDTLWTEDLTDGQRFGGLTVRNPFAAA